MRIPTKATTFTQEPTSPNCQQHPVQDASSKQQRRQKYKPSHQQTGVAHIVLPIRGGKKPQNSPPARMHAQVIPCMKLMKTTGRTLQGQKLKGITNSTSKSGKMGLQTQYVKKRQRNTAQMNKQSRDTQVQINEEEIGKPLEKEFRIMIVKMIQNLENRIEKMIDQLTET